MMGEVSLRIQLYELGPITVYRFDASCEDGPLVLLTHWEAHLAGRIVTIPAWLGRIAARVGKTRA